MRKRFLAIGVVTLFILTITLQVGAHQTSDIQKIEKQTPDVLGDKPIRLMPRAEIWLDKVKNLEITASRHIGQLYLNVRITGISESENDYDNIIFPLNMVCQWIFDFTGKWPFSHDFKYGEVIDIRTPWLNVDYVDETSLIGAAFLLSTNNN